MDHIKLKSPFRREVEQTPQLYPYSVIETVHLERPAAYPSVKFIDILRNRRSRRDGGMPDCDDVAALLWYCAKTQEISIEASGYQWEHRSAPSGGGRHPIDILVANYQGKTESLYLYDPLGHALMRLGGINQEGLTSFIATVNDVLPINEACIIWFAAQFDKTLSKYQDGESLVWLDAGCLLATTYLVAETLRLNCCAIGITGEPHISGILSTAPLVEGVAGCLVCRRL